MNKEQRIKDIDTKIELLQMERRELLKNRRIEHASADYIEAGMVADNQQDLEDIAWRLKMLARIHKAVCDDGKLNASDLHILIDSSWCAFPRKYRGNPKKMY